MKNSQEEIHRCVNPITWYLLTISLPGLFGENATLCPDFTDLTEAVQFVLSKPQVIYFLHSGPTLIHEKLLVNTLFTDHLLTFLKCTPLNYWCVMIYWFFSYQWLSILWLLINGLGQRRSLEKYKWTFLCWSRQGRGQLKGSVQAGPKWLFRSDFPSCSESAEIWHVYSFCAEKCPCLFFPQAGKQGFKHSLESSPPPHLLAPPPPNLPPIA